MQTVATAGVGDRIAPKLGEDVVRWFFGRNEKKDAGTLIDMTGGVLDGALARFPQIGGGRKALEAICVLVTEIAGFTLLAQVRKPAYCAKVMEVVKLPVMHRLLEAGRRNGWDASDPESVAMNWSIQEQVVMAFVDRVHGGLLGPDGGRTKVLETYLRQRCGLDEAGAAELRQVLSNAVRKLQALLL